MADPRLHQNLIDSSRQLFELDPDATILAEEGCFLGAGSPPHPVISNAAFRTDDSAAAEDVIGRARSFFGAHGRGFSLWIRGGEPEDADLAAAAGAAGLQMVYAMPEMTLAKRPETPPLPDGVELRKLSEPGHVEDYWSVAATSYVSLGFPSETFAGYRNHSGLLTENVVAFIAYLEGEPVSIAMTIVSHGVAGIYWVGSIERARGIGLGQVVTAAATNAGFDLGADTASLQASPMGKPIYERMGYETLFDYQLWMSPPP